MSDDLEARLKAHARSFDSLLSLIPAKLYYGEDNSDQWKRKKQTPEQKRAAKMAKLDPDNWKSAKDVADEREAAARKRKREEGDTSSDDEIVEPEEAKVPEDSDHPKSKKRKTTDPSADATKGDKHVSGVDETPEQRRQMEKERKAAKRERRRERKEKARLKAERQQARKKAEKQKQREQKQLAKSQSGITPRRGETNDATKESSIDEADDEEAAEAMELDHSSVFTSNIPIQDDQSNSASSDDQQDEVFSPYHESGTSSISSIQTSTMASSAGGETMAASQRPQKAAKAKQVPPMASSPMASSPMAEPQVDPKARLQAALSAFKSARTPDSSKSQPKSRAELLAQRRAHEEHRKAEKKAQKAREKEEAARKQEQEIAKRFSPGGSGSLLGSPRSPLIHSPSLESNNFNFGRIAFEDGSALTPEGETAQHRKKGPQDPRTALAAAQSKQARMSGLDAEKRENIASKDMWSNARRRASGEKVKDDTSLLKRALKRNDSQKKKSEKEWTERQDGINKSMSMRQKKRNDNLAKRRDEKQGGHQNGKKPGKVRRPGFEGSFRAGGKKKK